jgi:hypothetical protein
MDCLCGHYTPTRLGSYLLQETYVKTQNQRLIDDSDDIYVPPESLLGEEGVQV